MALYALGDLHLAFQSEVRSEAQRKSILFKDHERIFKDYCSRMLTDRDTIVLAGDHTWGKKLSDCRMDFEYIMQIPGRKILLRGNHDHFWDVKKTESLNETFGGRLCFLQNNFYSYGDYALVGTKGYCFEGPFYVDRQGHVIGYDEKEAAHADKLVEREAARLQKSFDAAVAAGYHRFIMFLHYPPTDIIEKDSIFTDMAEKYRVEQVVYAHCHGEERFHDSILGKKNGILYSLVSGDSLRWKPKKILD